VLIASALGWTDDIVTRIHIFVGGSKKEDDGCAI